MIDPDVRQHVFSHWRVIKYQFLAQYRQTGKIPFVPCYSSILVPTWNFQVFQCSFNVVKQINGVTLFKYFLKFFIYFLQLISRSSVKNIEPVYTFMSGVSMKKLGLMLKFQPSKISRQRYENSISRTSSKLIKCGLIAVVKVNGQGQYFVFDPIFFLHLP